jgi:hypothetical protein
MLPRRGNVHAIHAGCQPLIHFSCILCWTSKSVSAWAGIVTQKNPEPRSPNRVAENDENPSPARERTAKERLAADSRLDSGKNKAPPWKNLTLDELRAWYEDAKRRQGVT